MHIATLATRRFGKLKGRSLFRCSPTPYSSAAYY